MGCLVFLGYFLCCCACFLGFSLRWPRSSGVPQARFSTRRSRPFCRTANEGGAFPKTMHTIWSADWQESQRVPETLLAEWLESGDVQVRLKPNARGKIKPAYVATVRFHKVRDLSCQMGPRVIEAAMMGSAHHRAVVAAWA